jgi:hypothetical protein
MRLPSEALVMLAKRERKALVGRRSVLLVSEFQLSERVSESNGITRHQYQPQS